jgi:hypothetical protein
MASLHCERTQLEGLCSGTAGAAGEDLVGKTQMIYLALLFLMPSTIAVLAGLMILSLVGVW